MQKKLFRMIVLRTIAVCCHLEAGGQLGRGGGECGREQQQPRHPRHCRHCGHSDKGQRCNEMVYGSVFISSARENNRIVCHFLSVKSVTLVDF